MRDPVSKNGMDGSLGRCLASICVHTFVHDPPPAHTNIHEIKERRKMKERGRNARIFLKMSQTEESNTHGAAHPWSQLQEAKEGGS